MKKFIVFMMAISLFVLSGCSSESIIARAHLFEYLESEPLSVEVYMDDVESFENMRFAGFSNYGYADDTHLELRYLKDSVYAEVIYNYDYTEDALGNIELTIQSVEITYKNFDEFEYLNIVKTDINDYYQFDETAYDEFIVMLYELRLKDVVWVITSLGYELK